MRGRRTGRLRPHAWLGLAVLTGLLGVAGALLQPAASQPNEKKVRICHRTASAGNPYVVNEPAIANNGDLQGGHLNHTGPVFPAPGWGDIIPPYTYVDANGNTAVFPGYNWSPAGQAIWEYGCEPGFEPLVPTVLCIEPGPGGRFVAHFGYRNPNDRPVEDPAENYLVPSSLNGIQPTVFQPGEVEDAFQVESGGEDVTWRLTGNAATATRSSPVCSASITIVKILNPRDDEGRFALEIDGEVAGGASAVGDGGTTGRIAVSPGSHTVGESGAGGTSLADYDVAIVCVRGEQVVAKANAATVAVTVARGDDVHCTITNTRKAVPPVRPVLECVVWSRGRPAVAIWGYENPNAFPVRVPLGSSNRFRPAPANRGQPTVFEPGRLVGVFQTRFGGAQTLTWRLGEQSATAGRGSRRCAATLELRKATVPADDPGRFNLLLNGRVLVTGGHGTTTGPITIGIGEGTVSETAAAGTSLADYDSSVRCTRNGAPAVAVPGTKVDGAVADGDVVVCTFTNRRSGGPPPPPPPAPPSPPEPEPSPEPPPEPPVPPTPPPAPPLVDLAVTKTATPRSVVVGQRVTWTIRITNRSTVAAADVNGVRTSKRTYRMRVISVTPSQGRCVGIRSCNLGRIAPGASVTIRAVTEAIRPGLAVNAVRIGSEEQESDYLNNVASAVVRVTAPLRPPGGGVAPGRQVRCETLVVEPPVLRARSSSVVVLVARDAVGAPVPRLAVRMRGLGVDRVVRTNRRGIIRATITPSRAGIVLLRGQDARVTARASRCATLVGVLPARDRPVTG